jgi:uncharacterized membrane protein
MIGSRFVRQLRSHPRLVTAVIVALILDLLLPQSLRSSTRSIIALDAGGMIFLALSWFMMVNSTADHMRQRAAMQDEGRITILILTAGAAIFSLVTVAIELHGMKDLQGPEIGYRVGLAGATILCAWFVTHTMFALHYAHGYYSDGDPSDKKRKDVGGLDFPGDNGEPDYWDFLYFSFVIGMTFQTSDTEISSRKLRRLTLAHSILAFFFNTVILALSINIMAGLL